MPTRSTALSAPPTGAGRFMHWTWPARGSFFANLNSAASANGSIRGGGGDFGAASVLVGGATGSTAQVTRQSSGGGAGVNGASATCYKLHNGAAGDIAAINFGGPTTLIEQVNNPAFTGDPDKRVYSFRAVLAFTALTGPIGGADVGMQINPGNVNSMFAGANRPGIQFGPVDVGKIGLRARWQFVAPLTINDSLTFAQAGINDITDWNLFELRVVGASGAKPAILTAYVNGKRVLGPYTFGWNGGATLLPGVDSSGGGFLGLTSRVGVNNVPTNGGAAPYDMFVFNMAEVHAASENML